MLEHCNIEQVLETGLVEAVQVGIFEDEVRILAADIEVTLQYDAVLRQCAGFIRAQDVHRPEVLNRIEALDDDLLARHRHGTLRQIDGHDHRQHLGREPDRYGHREKQCLEPVTFG